eukprot:2884830-Rhodomonas_salina.4
MPDDAPVATVPVQHWVQVLLAILLAQPGPRFHECLKSRAPPYPIRFEHSDVFCIHLLSEGDRSCFQIEDHFTSQVLFHCPVICPVKSGSEILLEDLEHV